MGNEGGPKIILNNTVSLLFKTAICVLVISNHNNFQVLFDKIASVYFTRCYFNVHSKADMSQLNLPHGKNTTKRCKAEKSTHAHTRLTALFHPDRQPCQNPVTQFFTGRMPFLPPNQQRQSTEARQQKVKS